MAVKQTPIQKAKAALSGKTTRGKILNAENKAVRPKVKAKPKAKKKPVRRAVKDSFWGS